MPTLSVRIAKLEGKVGADEHDLSAFSDEELEQQVAILEAELRWRLTDTGVECVDMPIEEVVSRLEALAGGNTE